MPRVFRVKPDTCPLLIDAPTGEPRETGNGRKLQGGLPPEPFRRPRDWETSNKQARHKADVRSTGQWRTTLSGYGAFMGRPAGR